MVRKIAKGLEEQLASVIEQDGKILNTPQGVRRKKQPKVENQKSKIIFETSATHDAVAAMDRSAVNVIVGKGGGIPQQIKIRHEAHARSPYVVSLRTVLMRPEPSRAETSAAEVGNVAPFLSHRPVEAYAAVSSDLMGETDPWFTSHQFTPATFDEAYDAVYGRQRRWASACRGAVVFVVSLFQRIESVPEQAVADVKEALEIVEVPRFSFVRALAAFAGLAVVVTLPANAIALYRTVSSEKIVAEEAGIHAVSSLSSAAGASSLPESASALREASSQFRAVDSLLGNANGIAIGLASVMPKQFRSARALAEAGDKSSEAARLLALGFDKVFSDPGRRLDERLDVLGAYANSALRLLSDASRAAATVDASSIPEAQRDKAAALMSTLDDSTQAVREFAGLSGILADMAGKQELRKYLLLFQNPTELRPTGGFMGSFAEITVDRGAVKDIRVPSGGTYDLKGMLLARVKPPQPLQLIADRWQFQDANWSPDFPTAAEKIRWFWSKSGQSTVDGVISVNATFVQHLLDITGPIPMPKYGKTVDSSNFLLETQEAVELEYDKVANTPKKFIGDLSTELVARLKDLNKDQWLKVAALISDALETKDIQLALSDPEEETFAERYGWSGRIKPTSGDSLALIEANVAGQKTDGVVTEQVDHRVQIAEDGSITEHVTLTRTHTGNKGDLFTGVRNVSYLRAFVPEGSTLLSAKGFSAPDPKLFKSPDDTNAQDSDLAIVERTAKTTADGITIADENGRTTFGGWMQLDPGQTQTITFSYRIPMTAGDILQKTNAESVRPGEAVQTGTTGSGRGAYLLLLTNQSGKTGRRIKTTIEYPSAWNVAWQRPEDLKTDGTAVTYDAQWDRDRTVALFFSPSHDQTKDAQASGAE